MSPRHSIIRKDTIDYAFWLVFDADGGMRFSRGEPALGRGERSMACSAVLPRTLFRVPELKATIGVSDAAPGSFTIDVEAAGAALRQVIGCDIDFRVQQPEEQS